jgi:hypothetical protein
MAGSGFGTVRLAKKFARDVDTILNKIESK